MLHTHHSHTNLTNFKILRSSKHIYVEKSAQNIYKCDNVLMFEVKHISFYQVSTGKH